MIGAVTRWASIFAGLWIAVIVVGVPGLVAFIAMPALGALLMVAGVSSLKGVGDRGTAQRRVAVGHGGHHHLPRDSVPANSSVSRTRCSARGTPVPQPDRERSDDCSSRSGIETGGWRSARRRDSCQARRHRARCLRGAVLRRGQDIRAFAARGSRGRLSGCRPAVARRRTLDATLIDMLGQYADQLEQVNGRLYLTGVSDTAHQQVVRSGKLQLREAVHAHRRHRSSGSPPVRPWLTPRSLARSAHSGRPEQRKTPAGGATILNTFERRRRLHEGCHPSRASRANLAANRLRARAPPSSTRREQRALELDEPRHRCRVCPSFEAARRQAR